MPTKHIQRFILSQKNFPSALSLTRPYIKVNIIVVDRLKYNRNKITEFDQII